MIAHRKIAGCTYSERAQSKNVLRLPVQYAGKDRRRFPWGVVIAASAVGLGVLVTLAVCKWKGWM